MALSLSYQEPLLWQRFLISAYYTRLESFFILLSHGNMYLFTLEARLSSVGDVSKCNSALQNSVHNFLAACTKHAFFDTCFMCPRLLLLAVAGTDQLKTKMWKHSKYDITYTVFHGL